MDRDKTKEHKMICPSCGKEGVVYVEITLVRCDHHVISDSEDVVCVECSSFRETGIDNPKNEERFECPSCNARWPVACDVTTDTLPKDHYLLKTDSERGITYCDSRKALLGEIASLLDAYEENGERPEDALEDMSVAKLESNNGVLVPAPTHVKVVRDSNEWNLE